MVSVLVGVKSGFVKKKKIRGKEGGRRDVVGVN
jgi:hypothetical protein